MKLIATRLLIRYARTFMNVALLLFVGIVCMAMAGCGAPVWLTDASSIIGLVGASVTSIGSFVAGLTGNVALSAALAVIGTWITKIQTGIGDIEALVTSYNASPNPTVLADIEAALDDVSTNLATDFSNLGLPTSILSVIEGFAGLVSSQLKAWGSLIPAVKATSMQEIKLTVPYTHKEFAAAFDKLFEPTGDAEVDAIKAKVKKLK